MPLESHRTIITITEDTDEISARRMRMVDLNYKQADTSLIVVLR